jgi:hypothetical protein
MEISGMLAIGNGEPCPFCIKEKRTKAKTFVAQEGKDPGKHMIAEHKGDFQKILFGSS